MRRGSPRGTAANTRSRANWINLRKPNGDRMSNLLAGNGGAWLTPYPSIMIDSPASFLTRRSELSHAHRQRLRGGANRPLRIAQDG